MSKLAAGQIELNQGVAPVSSETCSAETRLSERPRPGRRACSEALSMTQSADTDRITYDKGKHVLRFSITDGGASIPCAVSKAALAALEDDALAGPHAMRITYQRNRSRIEAAASA